MTLLSTLLLIILSGVAVLILLVTLIIIISSKKKKKQKQEQLIQDKERVKILDDMILNPKSPVDGLRAGSEKPDEVVYTPPSLPKEKAVKRHSVKLLIEEISALSIRKYTLDPADLITIGSAKDNTIELTDAMIDAKQCEIGLYERDNKLLYLQNIGNRRVVLLRKKEWINVGAERIVLMHGDIIEIGQVRLRISIIK